MSKSFSFAANMLAVTKQHYELAATWTVSRAACSNKCLATRRCKQRVQLVDLENKLVDLREAAQRPIMLPFFFKSEMLAKLSRWPVERADRCKLGSRTRRSLIGQHDLT